MENNIKRLVLYPTEMMQLTGKSERTVRKWIAAIKKKHGKGRGSLITIEEFCCYTGINENKVAEYISKLPG